ncbi:ATP-binding protein [Apilactobacillus timberlakei]|uniref:ATP-binding protein n=1 Tax=Apilactobacillus timberlakei TaxID=2008380 RepID=UPI002989F83E|nr:ATP-binding protein [Apilactobacillus timberlakei]
MKKLGVIVAVDGTISSIGMYHMSNDSEYIWKGDLLNGVKVGSYLTILQNDIKIIANVVNEKVIDKSNEVTSNEFDNRYAPNSINRIVQLKTKGVIDNNKFFVTSKYTPMIGNQVTLTSKEDLNCIYSINKNIPCINIGKSLLESHTIQLPINTFFASHIGIFGNTGSGKSNTLHKLYYSLFKSSYLEGIKERSQFFVIDFNGEYTSDGQFGIDNSIKKVFSINTRNTLKSDKVFIKRDYILDADILSILFDAKPGTQVPFLRNSIKFFKKCIKKNIDMGNVFVGLLKKILTSGNSCNQDSLQEWISVAELYIDNERLSSINELNQLSKGSWHIKDSNFTNSSGFINEGTNSSIDQEILDYLKIPDIEYYLSNKFKTFNLINQLNMFLEFRKVYSTCWDGVNKEFLNPLFSRIRSSLNSLGNVIDVKENISHKYTTLNIFNFVNANKEVKRVLPMLISKMFYDIQKSKKTSKKVTSTSHLIIDEAHNILKQSINNSGDEWEDYRLSVFEEIIKEGRKFGFFLTLSSQRPFDISPTIMSQIHNYIIHRLVNDKDLQMVLNTMPTLDKSSFEKIPMLGKGEAIISGNAISIPLVVKVDQTNRKSRPDSDDVVLTDIWNVLL